MSFIFIMPSLKVKCLSLRCFISCLTALLNIRFSQAKYDNAAADENWNWLTTMWLEICRSRNSLLNRIKSYLINTLLHKNDLAAYLLLLGNLLASFWWLQRHRIR